MDIVKAQSAGFCMGVSLALRKLDEAIKNSADCSNIYIFGSIIHNPQVVKEYADKGILTATSADDIPNGATVVIRAHGMAKQIQSGLSQRGIQVVDATCPKVRDACQLIEESTLEGRQLLLYGEERHPEVKCLLSYAEQPTFVLDSLEEFRSKKFDPSIKYCLAAQTTQDIEVFAAISQMLAAQDGLDLKVLHTICDATKKRQEEAMRIADEVDFVVVAGGYNSSNTARLAQVVESRKTKALHIETAAELPQDILKDYSLIGLTAGASTPKQIIDEIQLALERL